MNICVSGECLSAINDEQLKTLIKQGNRPPLSEISGPAELLKFAKKWIGRCWHKSPDKRPLFDRK